MAIFILVIETKKKMKISNIFIDLGCEDKEEVEN
jgi:putative aminopeptidase FrvX